MYDLKEKDEPVVTKYVHNGFEFVEDIDGFSYSSRSLNSRKSF